MNERQDFTDLEQIFAAGDAWLLKYGVVTPLTHNNIILNIRVQFPKVKNVEYFLNQEERKIDMTLFVGKWFLLLGRKKKLIRQVLSIINEYLYGYEIQIKLRRYVEDN